MEPTPLKIRLVTLWAVSEACSYTRKIFLFSRGSSGLAGTIFSDSFPNKSEKIVPASPLDPLENKNSFLV